MLNFWVGDILDDVQPFFRWIFPPEPPRFPGTFNLNALRAAKLWWEVFCYAKEQFKMMVPSFRPWAHDDQLMVYANIQTSRVTAHLRWGGIHYDLERGKFEYLYRVIYSCYLEVRHLTSLGIVYLGMAEAPNPAILRQVELSSWIYLLMQYFLDYSWVSASTQQGHQIYQEAYRWSHYGRTLWRYHCTCGEFISW